MAGENNNCGCGCGPSASPINVYALPEIHNGTWWIGGVDSGVKVAYTPTVGANGNWWINGEDTGAPVNVLPEITADGFWSIGGVKTDKRAFLFVDGLTVLGQGSQEDPLHVNSLEVTGFITPAILILDSEVDLPESPNLGDRYVILPSEEADLGTMESKLRVVTRVDGEWRPEEIRNDYCIVVASQVYVCIDGRLQLLKQDSVGLLRALDVVEEIPTLEEGDAVVQKVAREGFPTYYLFVQFIGGGLSQRILKEGEEVRFIGKTSELYGRKFFIEGTELVEIKGTVEVSSSVSGDGSKENPLRIPLYTL